MTRTRDEVAKRAKALELRHPDRRPAHQARPDYPQANTEAVYQRMKTARQQQAAQYRAEGRQQALQIVGKANKDGEEIRGDADAQARQDLRRQLRPGSQLRRLLSLDGRL